MTGGGTGIGRATARELARTGARVAICGRRPEPLDAVRAELEAAGHDVLAMSCDVREPEEVEAFLDAVGERFGAVDVLVNNAGGQFAAPLEQIGLKGMRAVHRLNVDAPWHLTNRVAERWMIPGRRGFVCFVGFSPRRGVPLMAHSSAARAALENMASTIAIEWSKYGIRAVCVAAGLIQTEGMLQYGGQELVDEYAKMVPMGRPGRAEEVAADDRVPRERRRRLRDRDHGDGRRRRGRLGHRCAASATPSERCLTPVRFPGAKNPMT